MHKLKETISLIKDFFLFLRKRDSDSTACLIIAIAERLSQKHKQEMADYLIALRDQSV